MGGTTLQNKLIKIQYKRGRTVSKEMQGDRIRKNHLLGEKEW